MENQTLFFVIVLFVLGGFLIYNFYDSCGQKEVEINNLLEKANYCEVDSDCRVYTDLGCPFGCYNLVNRNLNLSLIESLYDEYQNENSCARCIYGCVASPAEESVWCAEGKCIIE